MLLCGPRSRGSESSAVCRFNIQDIREVFSGSYKTFDTDKHQWSTSGTNRNAQGKVIFDPPIRT